MDAFSSLVFIAYIVSILVLWYKNFWIVLPDFKLPAIIRSPTRRVILFVTGAIVSYSSIVGIWFLYGFGPAILAIVLSIIVSRSSYKRYLDREIRESADWEYRRMLRERSSTNDPTPSEADESEMRREAFEIARKMLRWRMTRKTWI